MTDSSTASFSLKYQARALAPVQADKFASKWIVGTNSLREENEVRILQYDTDQERVVCAKVYAHGPEIWDIATSGQAPELFITVWSQSGTYGASLWRAVPNDTLSKTADLQGHTGVVRSVAWHPQQQDLAITVEESALHKWCISDQGAQAAGQAQAGELLQLWSGALHARNPDVCATVGGNNLQLWDLRSMACTSEVQTAHRMPVRDVCFSQTSDYRLVTSGDDCKLRLWDMRMLSKGVALLELGGHSHWVWRAQFNPFYEQLIASSASDSLVNLYHTPQATSMAVADAPDSSPTKPLNTASVSRSGDLDGKAHTFDEHEDSVYGLAWSTVDPWLFASLSYDGRFVVNRVPKNIKYKILI